MFILRYTKEIVTDCMFYLFVLFSLKRKKK